MSGCPTSTPSLPATRVEQGASGGEGGEHRDASRDGDELVIASVGGSGHLDTLGAKVGTTDGKSSHPARRFLVTGGGGAGSEHRPAGDGSRTARGVAPCPCRRRTVRHHRVGPRIRHRQRCSTSSNRSSWRSGCAWTTSSDRSV